MRAAPGIVSADRGKTKVVHRVERDKMIGAPRGLECNRRGDGGFIVDKAARGAIPD
jgi:hypothetical protein